ncbi:hypothetical protein E1B28_003377 [Marasmius oreades]|uniref:Uncharacterized protein n=1 Tax=Marasmius oreades TaxID=181124 RepID=A0A9P7RMG8_9AGAR|nr:uncharacterized protein E1B28_003377 [Marasmius oreades]KAG7085840.1 hypothetical protein E1B28_003377 [Marasmius oreades]
MDDSRPLGYFLANGSKLPPCLAFFSYGSSGSFEDVRLGGSNLYGHIHFYPSRLYQVILVTTENNGLVAAMREMRSNGTTRIVIIPIHTFEIESKYGSVELIMSIPSESGR